MDTDALAEAFQLETGCSRVDLRYIDVPEMKEQWVICICCRERLRVSTEGAPTWWDSITEEEASQISEGLVS